MDTFSFACPRDVWFMYIYIIVFFYNILQVYVLVLCVAEEKDIDIISTYASTYTDAVSDSTCRMHIMYTVGGTKTVTSLYPSTILVQEHLRSWKSCLSPSSIP